MRSGRIAAHRIPLLTVLVAGLVAVGATGCGLRSAAREPIVIGYVAARSGFGAVGDVDGVDGVRYEVQRLKNSGGIAGHPIKLIVEDIGADPTASGAAARRLIDKGASILLGPPFPDTGRGAVEVAAAAHIPILSVTSTQPSFIAGHDGEAFLGAFGDNTQGAAAAEEAYAEGKRRAFTITSPDVVDYTDAVPAYFAKAFAHAGGRLVGTVDIHINQAGFQRAALAVASTEPAPDIVYTTIFPPDLGPLLRTLRAAGYRGSVFSSDASDNKGVFAVDPRDAEGLVVTTHGFPEAPRSGLLFSPKTPAGSVDEFERGFVKFIGHRPISVGLAALGADAVDIVNAAAEAGDSIEPSALARNIGLLERADVTTGRITYRGTHGIPRKVVYLARVEDGRFRLIRAMEPDYVPPVRTFSG
ncbi:MAG: ABC transporter substrate-binding protein [Acidimicrobiales bacterium]